MSAGVNTGPMWLVYRFADGSLCYQPWSDLTESGTVIDPQTDDDAEMIGWATEESRS